MAPGAGRLGFVDKLRLARDVVRAQLAARRRSDGRAALPPEELDDVKAPQTPLARAAERACNEASPPWLVNHVLRTWLWAELLARHDGIARDRDLLYAAAILHDLGLTDRFRPEPGGCFAIAGARGAFDLAREAGADAAAASRIAEAIALHLDLGVAIARGAEAHLLQRGAAADVIGTGLHGLSRPLRERVNAQHPRDGFVPALSETMRKEAALSPNTRIGIYCRRLGFLKRIERAWPSPVVQS